ncbi:MAG TPA: hypothetical protein VGZ90_04010 [Puia sp.]|jgi:hypothetical protein|nr:hypothetical protein [Puia sp.]
MQYPKNIQFTQLIKAGGRLREFNFRKSLTPEGPLFTVDTVDPNGGRHYILFRLEDNQWILKTKNMVAWIEEVIPQIKQAIGLQ